MDAPADAFGPINRPAQVGLKAVATEAIIDPTPILTNQQGAGSSEDFAHCSPGPDIVGSGLHPAALIRAAQRVFDVAAGFRNWSPGGAIEDRNSRRRTRSLRAVIDVPHISLPTFAREATR
jgi:hypothetical protein